MGTLWAALEGLPARRTKKARRCRLASVVVLSLAAMLSGANDLVAIFRWGRRLTAKSLAMLGIDRPRSPCHATWQAAEKRPSTARPLRFSISAWPR